MSRFVHTFHAVFVGGALLLGAFVPACPAQVPGGEAHSPEEHHRFAEGLLVRRFYDMAEVEFRAFLDSHPGHELAPRAMLGLIESLRAQPGKAEEAMAVIGQFQARWPDHEQVPRFFLWRGEHLMRQGEIAAAADCFRRLIDDADSATREVALYFLAQCQTRQGDHGLAAATYRALADAPFDAAHLYRPYAVFNLAAIAQGNGDFEAAGRGYARLASPSPHVPQGLREQAMYRLGEMRFLHREFTEAIELYEALLVDFPSGAYSREARKRRAWAHQAAGNHGKALELVRDWRQRYGDVSDFEMDYLEATALVKVDLWEDALPVLARLKAGAGVPDDYVRLARVQEVLCLMQMERHGDAVVAANAFLHDYPKAAERARMHYLVGESLVRVGDHAAAIPHLRRAVAGNGATDLDFFADACLRLTASLEQAGRHKEAATVFRGLVGNQAFGNSAYALLRAAECERKAADEGAAVADLERLLSDFPDAAEESTRAIHMLGELYMQRHEYERAIGLLDILLRRHEPSGRERLLFFLGYLHFRQGKLVEAEARLREALAQPDSASIAHHARYYLGGTLLDLERIDEALAIFAELLALPPAERPAFSDELQFRLEALYYQRNRFEVSEAICQALLESDNEETVRRARLRLVQILIARNRLAEAQKTLEEILAALPPAGEEAAASVARLEVLCLLGEIHLLRGDNDRAAAAFERALARPGLDMPFAARARWGLADILFRERRLNQALHVAINALVLSDDPTYTPRAMFIAVQILAEQERLSEALTTWRELQARYAAFAEQRRLETVVQKLLNHPQNKDASATTPEVPAP